MMTTAAGNVGGTAGRDEDMTSMGGDMDNDVADNDVAGNDVADDAASDSGVASGTDMAMESGMVMGSGMALESGKESVPDDRRRRTPRTHDSSQRPRQPRSSQPLRSHESRCDPIDTVMFDLGGVISIWAPQDALCSRYKPETIRRFFDAVDFDRLNSDLDEGMSWEEAYERVASLPSGDPIYPEMLRWYHDHFDDTQAGRIPGAAQMVRDLKAAGIRVFGLTNWNAETFLKAEPAAPIIGSFDDVLVSGRCHLREPDPRFYRLAIERFSLIPERTLFVDDRQENVDGASREGIGAVLFQGTGELRRILRDRGVAIPALR